MRTKATIFFAVAMLAGTAHAADRSDRDGIAINNAKQAVQSQLRDADSAEFRRVAAYHPISPIDAPTAVCGEVNARNGSGGYTGYTAFVWMPMDADMHADLNGTAYVGRDVPKGMFHALCHN